MSVLLPININESTYYLLISLLTTCLFVCLLPIDESKVSVLLPTDESTYYLLMSLLTTY